MLMRTTIETNRPYLYTNSTACNYGVQNDLDVSISHMNFENNVACELNLIPHFTVVNHGSTTVTSLKVQLSTGPYVLSTQTWSGTLASGVSSVLQLNNPVDAPTGELVLTATILEVNGGVDPISANNSASKQINFLGGKLGCEELIQCEPINSNVSNGPGNFTMIQLNGPFAAIAPAANFVQFCVSTRGDVNGSTEKFQILDEDGNFQGWTFSTADCIQHIKDFCFNVPVEDYNNWIVDNQIVFTFDPISTDINAGLCNSNEICLKLNIPLDECKVYAESAVGGGNYSSNHVLRSSTQLALPYHTVYTSEKRIILKPGFSVPLGVNFESRIADCPN